MHLKSENVSFISLFFCMCSVTRRHTCVCLCVCVWVSVCEIDEETIEETVEAITSAYVHDRVK